ncbi:acetate/propionate family kinase [Hoeflea sp. EC-HK425]|uniref:acetate/propionate family kinase n=1 Tax=Hoeflea sp. EC-HK425 TaxID=2038388 RepID=UPI0012517BBC|nr:acetate/propionate family kinase [Hoeflea sp. EC-HK425]VVT00074.1 Acetate kinase [Hoeflea sp. EC-HK425]
MSDSAVLTLNAGSSSLKFAIFTNVERPRRLWSGAIERIGLPGARFRLSDARGAVFREETGTIADHDTALKRLLLAIEHEASGVKLVAVGHRIAHGGPDCDCPEQVTPTLRARLQQLTALAPLHLPANIAGIDAVRIARPDLTQIACFDTSFHRDLPPIARLSGLPRALQDEGLRRFGFHGLSYEYIVKALRDAGVAVDAERIVVAHLGNGASMCAIRDGKSLETTMGFSTIAGLPMGTRSGDVDPGLLLHLLIDKEMTPEAVSQMLYAESGLLGLSGISRNMQELLQRPDDAAAEAVAYFCYHARRHLAGLTATLGGVDRLVFTGGIGANAPQVRAGICDRLGYLGIELNKSANLRGDLVISTGSVGVTVEIRQIDEEAIIAGHAHQFMASQPMAREA